MSTDGCLKLWCFFEEMKQASSIRHIYDIFVPCHSFSYKQNTKLSHLFRTHANLLFMRLYLMLLIT